jgi:PAS domain S-box-containing protein
VTALWESEKRFRQIAENIGEVVWLTDFNTGRVIYVSPVYEKIWNRPRETLYKNQYAWIDAVHPDDRVEIGTADQQMRDIHYRIVQSDGTHRWIHDRSFPVEDAEGRIYRIARIAEDVTRQRLLEDELRHAQKMEAIGQFAGTVAHDFSNALAIITGHGQLALERLPPDHPIRHHLVHVRNAAFRASSLTRQLLGFSRKTMLRPRPIDINYVMARVGSVIDRLVGEDVQLKVDLAASVDMVNADPGQIEQVILNLLSNSRDAMPGGGTVRIETRNVELDEAQCAMHPDASPGRYVTLTVSDTGVGMDEATIVHIFEPFFTTKPEGKGTGLGLATVYGIVKQIGGFISVTSAPHEGTTMTIYFPAIDEPANDPNSLEEERSATILVMEHDSVFREWTRDMLGRAGYTVREARGRDEALRLAQTERSIDLILLNADSPHAGGADLVDQITELHPGLKVLYISIDAEPGSTAGAPQLVNFIRKPFSSERLLQRIREILDSERRN